jgi:hypothetical protein
MGGVFFRGSNEEFKSISAFWFMDFLFSNLPTSKSYLDPRGANFHRRYLYYMPIRKHTF